MNYTVSPELIGIFISIIVYLLTFAYFFGGLNKRIDYLEKDLKEFKIEVSKKFDEVSKKFDEVSKKFDEVSKKFDEVSKKFDEIYKTLFNINHRLGVVEGTLSVAGNSPLQLTEGGKEIVSDLDANKFIQKNYQRLKQYVLNNNHESKYDIQVLSSDAVRDSLPKNKIIDYKDYAYKKGWTLEHVYDAVGLVLRDKILQDMA